MRRGRVHFFVLIFYSHWPVSITLIAPHYYFSNSMLNYLSCDSTYCVWSCNVFLFYFIIHLFRIVILSPFHLSIVMKLTRFSCHQAKGRRGPSDGEAIVERGMIVRKGSLPPSQPQDVSCWGHAGLLVMGTFTHFMLRGLRHASLTYVIPCCYS